VTHGETGMLFKTRDTAGLSEILRLLANSPGLRRKLSSAAICRIHDGFSLAAAARRMGEIYSKLLP